MAFTCDAADFDGTNDNMTRGAALDGAADSETGILSVWVRFDGGNGTQMRILSANPAGTGGFFEKQAANTMQLLISNVVGVAGVQFVSNGAYTAGATWYNFLASWDSGAEEFHFYVNDVSDGATPTFSLTTTLDYDGATNWGAGGATSGAAKLNGCMAEYYFAPGQFLDFSVEANRRKFIGADLKPVDLGSDGSTPTGAAPIIYFHLSEGEAVANFATNRGTGGNFSITGSLDIASTTPSHFKPVLLTTDSSPRGRHPVAHERDAGRFDELDIRNWV